IRARVADLDTDFWIEEGEKPLLRKLAVDLSDVVAQSPTGLTNLVITYDFSNWNVSPEFKEGHFDFAPPEGATELRAQRPVDPMEGEVAPAFSPLPILGSEQKLDLAQHKDKHVVILDFWASWCTPCRVGLPIVTEVAQEFKDKGVVLYAVNTGEDEA